MTVKFYRTLSDKRTMYKNLTNESNKTIVLKNDNSLTNPTIVVTNFDETKNYFYIEDYDRYYFVTDYRPLTGHRTEVVGHIDVLMSFKEELSYIGGFLKRSTYRGNSMYSDLKVKTQANDSYEILPFIDSSGNEQKLASSSDGTHNIVCIVG